MPTPETARALIVKFDAAKAFPPDDKLSVRLLRLMMATDDVRHLQKLLIMARQPAGEASQADQAIFNGELGHLFRLLAGHLYEAAFPFRAFDQVAAHLSEAATAQDPDARSALEQVREAFDEKHKRGLRYEFLNPVRHSLAFHYKEEPLEAAFRKRLREGHLEGILTLSEFSGLGRFTFVDHIATFVIADAIGEGDEAFPQRFTQMVGEAIQLAGALATVVDNVVGHLLVERIGDALERQETMLKIPPPLRRAKDAVEAGRRGRPG